MTIHRARRRRSGFLGLLGLVLILSAWQARTEPARAAPESGPSTDQADARLRQRLASKKLRWGGDEEGGVPFQYRDPHNPTRVVGFEVELADALADSLSRRLHSPIEAEFVPYEWVSLAKGLERADFDLIASGFEITPERRRVMRFSRPYYIYAQQLVVRRAETHIKSLADCLGLPVGTLSGSAADVELERAGIQDRVGFDGQVEPFLDLELGRVDAVLLDSPIVTFYGLPNPKLKMAGAPFAQGAYGLGVRLDDVDLAQALDRALGELMISGRLREILARWRMHNQDQVQLARGAQRAAELRGLGFEKQGANWQAKFPVVADVVPLNLVAQASADLTFFRYAPVLLKSAVMTVAITLASMALAMTIGLVVCLARLYGPRGVRWLALGYVEFFRGIPLLLLLFFLYFGLASLGLELPALATAVLGFGMNYGAYEAEVYRSAISAVPERQWEAARALGMHDRLAFRRIIFPQALRTALGPMTNDFVALFKDTSLVSVIAVRELTKEYLILARSSEKFIELGLLTAILYLAMSVPLGYVSRWLERRAGIA